MAPPHQNDPISSTNAGHGSWLRSLPGTLWGKVEEIARQTKELATNDPRRVTHSLKLGLALTLVSLFYYFKPLYDGLGVNAIWAVLTVVIVFEFSVGATLGKGVNRMVATVLAGVLGVGAHHLATLSGRIGEPILIAFFVFIIGAVVTLTRFFPRLKARYDYGLSIFILTFSLVSVSGYRDDQVIKMAHMRVSTIIIGSITAIVVSIVVLPVWVGEDLHNLVADHLDKLGDFLEGFGSEYFRGVENGEPNHDKKCFQGYQSVLSSKDKEETMANLARWEPCHGGFKFSHPWKQYLKIGSIARECAFKIHALNSYLSSNTQHFLQAPDQVRIRSQIEETCKMVCSECGKALKELASTTKKLRRAKSAETHIAKSKSAAENMKLVLQSINLSDVPSHVLLLQDIVSVAAVVSLLLQVVEITEEIGKAVSELGSVAGFKDVHPTVSPEQPHLLHRGAVSPLPAGVKAQSHVVVTIGD